MKPVRVGDTVVLCRPDQWREAAVVSSLGPSGTIWPIITVAPPPRSRADYLEARRRFREVDRENMSRFGTPLGNRESVLASSEDPERAVLRILAHQRERLALTDYRSLIKYKQNVNVLLRDLNMARAVFLFPPDDDDLMTRDPEDDPEERERSASTRLVADLERVDLVCDSVDALIDLNRRARSSLRCGTSTSPSIHIRPDAPVGTVVAALFVALEQGTDLVVSTGAVDDAATLGAAASRNPGSGEAVLAEEVPHASTMTAAIYARYRQARLILTPEPDLVPVQRAVQARQRWIDGGRGSSGEQGSREFLSLFATLFSSRSANSFTDIEKVVSAQVPGAVVDAVGERSLTVFTTGLPYTFVRRGDLSWCDKPIGHVAADPELVVLQEFRADTVSEDDRVWFSVVLDPGYFEVSETEEVLRSLREGSSSWPLLVSGPDASDALLFALAHDLSIDLLFFNTHGYEGGIILGDHFELPSGLVAQHLALNGGAVVFNNSCQSWTGVGREFIRTGARGYVGSLWSIPSDLAAEYGRVVTDRMVRGGREVAAAMTHTKLQPLIERSYIFAGTARTRLASVGPGHDRMVDRESKVMQAWIQLALVDARFPGSSRFLQARMRDLRAQVAGVEQRRPREFVALAVAELRLFLRHEDPTPSDVDAASELVSLIERVIPTLPEDDRADAQSNLYTAAGDLYYKHGQLGLAHSSYARIGASDPDDVNRADALLRKASSSMQRGEIDAALDAAREAVGLYESAGRRRGVLAATGVIGQVHKRLGQYDEALQYAQDGYRMAVELDDVQEQMTYKIDESAMLRVARGDLDAAAAAATTAVGLARRRRDQRGELIAIGCLVNCLTAQGRLGEAEDRARWGLDQARAISERTQEASFHHDLGEIHHQEGAHEKSFDEFDEAAAIYSSVGASVLAAGAVLSAAQRLERCDRPEERIARVLERGLTIAAVMGPTTPVDMVASLVEALKAVVRLPRPQALGAARHHVSTIDAAGDRDPSYPFGLLLAVASTVYSSLRPETADTAMTLAAEIDGGTDRRFALTALVSEVVTGRAAR